MGRIESLFGSNFNLIVNMIPLCYFLLVVLHALENALRRKRRLKKHDYRDIKKLPEVIFYSVASALIGWLWYSVYNFPIWELVALSVVTRMAFFNPTFNIFSDRYVGYESLKGNSTWDRITRGNYDVKFWFIKFHMPNIDFWVREVIYLGMYITLLICSRYL